MLKITDIFINSEKFPIGIDEDLDITWCAKSDKENVILKKCRVILYDDDKVYCDITETAEMSRVRIPLIDAGYDSLKKYNIKLKIWDETGDASEWFESAGLITGILREEEWTAEMISAESEADKEFSGSEYFYKKFNLKGKIKAAYACVSAWGLYELYINGNKAGDALLTPGWTSYHKHLCYQMYDITDMLSEGDNLIGILVGAGWYKGLMGPYLNRNNYGAYTGAICQIKVVYADNNEELLTTDSTWEAVGGPVVFADIYNGEIYDARQEFNEAEIKERDIRSVRRCDFKKDSLKSQYGARVKAMEEMKIKRIFRTPKGELVADVGQNFAGRPVISSKAWTGAKYELQCFEILGPDGNVYTENLRTARQTIVYYCKDDQPFVYAPHFSYQGYRYIYIKEWPGEVKKEELFNQVLYSSMRQTGTFLSSDKLLNKLHDNILWSLKSNFVDIPTDCPQRDERMGWTGDAQIFCSTACFLMDTENFYRKWLTDLRADQKDDGGIPHVIPDIVSGVKVNGFLSRGADSAAAWADAVSIVPWQMYLSYGDIRILDEQYEAMKKWVEFVHRHAEGVIWKYKLQFGDWVALDAEEGSYFGATPVEYVSAVYYLESVRILYSAAKLLGVKNDYHIYRNLYDRNLEDFQRIFFDEKGTLKVHTQTAVVQALYFHLFPDGSREKLVCQLKNLLEDRRGHLVTGFTGTPYICFALSRNGEQEEAYRLLMRKDFPSWLYQVEKGATTIWEHWDGVKEDGTLWDPHMNSFNHYSYGAIGDWMYKELLGIRPDESMPGYKHFYIYPYIPDNLISVQGSYFSRYGEIKVSWKKEMQTVKLSVCIPVNTTADIGIQNIDGSDKQVGSGTYEFVYYLHRDE